MKKLSILKATIDLLYYMSIPILIILLLLVSYIFLSDETNSLAFKINGQQMNLDSVESKLFVLIGVASYLLIIYCIYLFRKILTYFVKTEIFNKEVITNFNKMGMLIITYVLINLLCSFLYDISDRNISLELGNSPYLTLICLGLFFMVLSEIFKIAKNQKEENDLTI